MHVNGPALVLSGAGSGKTLVITRRIMRLMELGIPAADIVALTFTNKAAREMRERVTRMAGSGPCPLIATFHAFCLRYLRMYGNGLPIGRTFTIVDRDEQKKIQREVLKSGQCHERIKLAEFQRYIVHWKHNHHRGRDAAQTDEEMTELAQAYQAMLRKNRLLDFDDLLLYFIDLLHKQEIRQGIQKRCRYILVDEYQDTNRTQYRILRLLVGRERNLFVVGDDDQSIYGFRGACVENILEFERDFPDTRVIKLQANYRSQKHILLLANAIIRRNARRKAKEMTVQRSGGGQVVLLQAADNYDEARRVADGIARMHALGYAYDDMAVLYRTNAQSLEFEQEFMRRGWPHKVISGQAFFARKEIKDIMAYLHFLLNPQDERALARIINTPPRRIGQKSLAALLAERDGHQDLHELVRSSAKRNVMVFAGDMEDLWPLVRSADVGPLVVEMLRAVGYEDYLLQTYSDADSRLENIQRFLALCHEHDAGRGGGLRDFMDAMSLMSDQDQAADNQGIKLLTVHAAKGLEFPCVCIVGLEDAIFPHRRALEPGDRQTNELEEERRLFYVAVTRAKDRLYLSYARSRRNFFSQSKSAVPSRFLTELPQGVLADAAGMPVGWSPPAPRPWTESRTTTKRADSRPQPRGRDGKKLLAKDASVIHPRYGPGKVVAVYGPDGRQKVDIFFLRERKKRSFLRDKVKLSIL